MAKRNYHTESTVNLVTELVERAIPVPEDNDRTEIIRLLKDWDEKNPDQQETTPPKETVPPPAAKGKSWVKVYQMALENGVDFMFTTDVEKRYGPKGELLPREPKQYHIFNGEPVLLADEVIEHLRGCHYPRTQLKQGETGGPVKVMGSQDRYSIVPCAPPAKSKKVPVLAAD